MRERSDGQAVGLGEVDGYEVDTALHQLGDERDVARQPVELGDHQGGAVQAAQAKRPGRSLRLPLSTSVTSSAKLQLPPLR